ncbi:FAD/NAD-binding domain-containing protein [Ramaria rubella]|nr:FAD/NAD-binding domain-containing protein [Ramaria rubella]
MSSATLAEANIGDDSTGSSLRTASSAPLVVVVGAGPVGCLTALAFAGAGWRVQVYEGRPDMRLPSSKTILARRSTNLTISSRGLIALQSVNPSMMKKVLELTVPIEGRLIHARNGKAEKQLYDPNGQASYSIERGILNECLLEEALAHPAIGISFNHKLVTADFDIRRLTFLNANFDLCVGADGSYSAIRSQMMRVVRMDYEQEYIPHEYIELNIPSGTDESGSARYLLDPNLAHIWPRHSFVLIALSNKNKTFTSALFAPTSELAKITSRADASVWFRTHFPDAVDLVGEETLLNDFQRNPRNPLISLKVKPYHYKDRCIILGDAAHSVVPFYGQGLNCGLEDVRVLLNILRNEGVLQPRKREEGEDVDLGIEQAFRRYSETRYDDLVAIRDLSMKNYVELRHTVTTPGFIFRKMVDNFFSALSAPYMPFSPQLPLNPSSAPQGWLPLYSMVTFRPDISYATAKMKAERQSRIINGIGLASLARRALLNLRELL